MGDLPKTILLLAGGAAVPLGLLILVFLNPEKAQIWLGMFWRGLSYLGQVFRSAQKRYTKLDLQGRVNHFTKKLEEDAPYLASTKVRVEWEEGQLDRKSFLEGDQVILRLKRDDPDDSNFVHGAYLFVSTALLHRTKRYISPSHRESIDLYVTTKLLQRERQALVGVFLDEYLHPRLVDSDAKVGQLYDSYSKIDRAGMFFPVFLQEMDFLGGKVFGARKDDQIIVEVNSLVAFLEGFSQRKIGDEGDLDFERSYCRFAFVIVGKPSKMTTTGEAYAEYIKRHLTPKRIETLYIVGRAENKLVLDEVCRAVNDSYERFRSRTYRVPLRYNDELVERDQYLVILRLRDAPVYQPSDSQSSTDAAPGGPGIPPD